MTKVVLSKKQEAKVAARSKVAVASKRVRDNEGHLKTLHTLDFGSDTFGRDLQSVFAKNVTKARRENKRVVGSTDFAVTKR